MSWPGYCVTESLFVTDSTFLVHKVDGNIRGPFLTWLRRHGIDPMDLPVENTIERLSVERRVYFDAFVKTEDGKIKVVAHEAVIERRFIQLEAPPMPWPIEIRRTTPREADEKEAA